jgi:hypothetical protein
MAEVNKFMSVEKHLIALSYASYSQFFSWFTDSQEGLIVNRLHN